MDNRGNRLIVTDDSAINTPAVSAAHAIRRYSAKALDEISFKVRVTARISFLMNTLSSSVFLDLYSVSCDIMCNIAVLSNLLNFKWITSCSNKGNNFFPLFMKEECLYTENGKTRFSPAVSRLKGRDVFNDTDLCHNVCNLIISCMYVCMQVGDIISIIDMPPSDESSWWRGKHGFEVISLTS